MITAQFYYESVSKLKTQYANAMKMDGQDRIKALESYKRAVFNLQQQFTRDIPGLRVTAREIATKAIADIQQAAADQQAALSVLIEGKQKQVAIDHIRGLNGD